ncbi:MAG: Fe(2+)-trafficking protein [Phycisphaerales bacterium]
MDIASRIAQFENMAQADPSNEMAHFSLGQAYMQAARFADAAASFERCVALSPELSKAYQLAGEAHIKAGDTSRAAAVLHQGHTIAAQRGDFMPRTAIAGLLRSIGEAVPEESAAGDPGAAASGAGPGHAGPVPEGKIVCRQSGRLGTQFARPPFKGAIGQWIAANISRETFDLWIKQGTKVINELRLDLSRDRDQEVYDQHMREFLGIDESVLAEIGARS